ncbi:amino acid adenylation protein [[Clostridium] cellulosi]|uniref:Phenolphthiocerol/phthiocerol polyketide synthase subunit E n=1 Tax=[Clostridium] cellulosi TaxID=29343 RepID=A0A078KSA5_9FIRM|nr:amino acid adenylation protein [[Clostridium] cellulosi]
MRLFIDLTANTGRVNDMQDFKTLTELLVARKNEEQRGITFILDSNKEEFVSYKDLYYKALKLLGSLQKYGFRPGDKVIFQIDDNRSFINSFWACILGGMIPVPMAIGNNDEQKSKLFKIWKIIGNPRMITSQDLVKKLKSFADKNGLNEQMNEILKRVIFIDNVILGEDAGEIYYPKRDDMAFIQFSSGSTGDPKGVIITHGNVLTNISAIMRWSKIDTNDVSLNWVPLTHDMGLIGVHIKDVIVDINQYNMPTKLFIENPTLWLEKASEHRATLLYSPNFGFKHFLESYKAEDKKDWDLSSIRLIYNGAEPISMGLCNEFLDKMAVYGLKRSAMHPAYGLAEGTIAVAFPNPGEEFMFHVLDRNHLNIGQTVKDTYKEDRNAVVFMDVGYPIYDCYVRICDEENNEIGENKIGYIQIRGGNVTTGYYNNKEATEKAITKDGWFNTGDLGFLRNKRLTITGRAKDVILVSGQNYYSQDIERIAESAEGVETGTVAAVGVFNKEHGSDDLILFIRYKGNIENFVSISEEVKQVINEKLGIEVSEVIPVNELPKTSSGKVQRFKLGEGYAKGEYDLIRRQLQELSENEFENREIVPPENETQKKLIDIWREILNVKRIGISDNFFSLGGDSLKITQLVSRIKDTFGISLDQSLLFENPDIENMSRIIEEYKDNRLKEDKIKRAAGDRAELSFAQQRLWFLDKLDKNSPQYNLYKGIILKGKLNKAALNESLNLVMNRHEILQMSFSEDNGRPVQIFNPDATITLENIDLRNIPESERWEKASLIAKEVASKPFNLEEAPLFRGKLLCMDKDEHILLLAVHHIVFDGWSFGIFLKELGFYYDKLIHGTKKELPELEIQYADYALWQKKLEQEGALDDQIKYWKKRLSGNLPILNFPTDKPRPAVQTYNGRKIQVAVPEKLLKKLKAYAENENATLFMVLFAAFNVLLYKYTGQTDIILGSPIANRSRKDIEGLIGFFTNNIVLRTVFTEDIDFQSLLKIVKKETLEAYSNQDVPFEKLVEELHVERNMSRNPVFQFLFGMQNTPMPNKVFSDIYVSYMDIDGGYSRFDLSVDVHETGDGLILDYEYNTDLFNDDTIIRFAGHYNHLLAELMRNPQERINKIEILTDEDKEILSKLNDTERTFDSASFIELFERQAKISPDAIAAESGNEKLTYRELDEISNKLANYLISLGAAPETIIAIYMERSVRMLVGLLGILKSGAAYLPLDPIYPKERIKLMLEDADVKLILSEQQLYDSLPDIGARIIDFDQEWNNISQLSAAAPKISVSGNNLAYVIYTSGSTGKPKGVQIERHSLDNFLKSMAEHTGIGNKDALLAVTTVSFDIAALELYLPLICGARTVIASREETIDGEKLSHLLNSKGITIMQATPATWRLLLESGWEGTAGLKALCGGESLPNELAEKILERCESLYNVYGPTETTIWSTIGHIEKGDGIISIGKPIANTQVYILDKSLNRVPVGVPGELFIGGEGTARGYMNLPQQTSERFIRGKAGGRLYKTGDLAKCTPDGKLICLGRIDNQVKIRGYRIELGEIESLLKQLPQVKDCIVADKEIISGEKSLVAYIIPAVSDDDHHLSPEYLRDFLSNKLPSYMVPSAYVLLSSFPMTANGKIDRKALPIPKIDSSSRPDDSNLGETEKIIASIWRDVLKTDNIGVNQNFFDVGGHSLLLAQVRSRLVKAFNKDISMMDLFRYPTIHTLSEFIEGGEKSESDNVCIKTRAKKDEDNSIAVIGMSGRFPGAKNIDEFWENLCAGKESISRFTDEEMLAEGVSPDMLNKPGYVKAGGSIEDIDKFDASFFGYNAREAELLDPQQRIFLEEAWKALENAGYDAEKFGGLIGVYGSIGMNTYAQALKESYASKGLAANYQIMTSNDKDFLATRVAYKLGLEGPAITVQTACSSSLVAVHLACLALINGECDMALAGGVCVRIPQKAGYLYEEGMILSPDGHCRAFDSKASGTVSGNGAGVVVLKRLKDAIRDGDNISAVIKGSAINNDGSHKIGYTAPAIDGQAKAIAAAQAKAQVNPETITYIEAHGTGTPLGDPIEIEALTKVFRDKTDKKGYCAIGSVKTNIGHLDAAAGIAGLIKTVLCIRNKMLPPSLNFESPNPKCKFESSPFYVNTTLKEWKNTNGPLRAGVSSFGIGGTNAHVILEEAPAIEQHEDTNEPCILVFSAKDKEALDAVTNKFFTYLKQNKNINIHDAAYTLQVGRREFDCRRFLVCNSVEDALKAYETINNPETRFHDNVGIKLQPKKRIEDKELENLALEEIGFKWLQNAEIDWERLYKGKRRRRLPLPTYPFKAQSYWFKKNGPLQNQNTDKNFAKAADIADWFYTPIWKQSSEEIGFADIEHINSNETVLVLKNSSAFSDALTERMANRGIAFVTAIAGRDFSAVDGVYVIDIDDPDHYEKLISEVTQTGKALRIINLLGVTEEEFLPESEQSVTHAKKLFYSMLYLAKAIGKLSTKPSVRIIAVTDNSQRIFGEKTYYPEKAIHLGACRVIPKEYPNISCGSIDVSMQENSVYDADSADRLIDTVFSESGSVLTAIRGEQCWKLDYEHIKLSAASNPAVKIRQNGVYVITGGLGGIGLAIAKYLAKKAAAKLVLVGRSQFPDESSWDHWIAEHGKRDKTSQKILQLKELRELGAEVFVCKADVTDYNQMKNLRETVEERFGTINGIIHAAGIPGGGMIQFKTKESAENVFAPKIQGTLAVYSAFKDCGLDFILLSSSLNAITGGFGQADYSGANAFLDAFAISHNKNNGTRVISIDWDRWPGVGMASTGAYLSEAAVNVILGSCISDNSERIIYSNTLSPEKDWVLSEHKIMDIPTVAGTVYLEMARAAFEDITGGTKAEISNVVFLNPMAVRFGEQRKVFTILKKAGDYYEFNVVSETADGSGKTVFQEHARGRIAANNDADSKHYDLERLKERCSEKSIFPSPEMPTVSEAFISFGGRWRSLVNFSVGNGEGLALVALDKKYLSELDSIKLHPAVLDTATGVVRLATGGNFLPLAYDSIKLYGKLPGTVYSYIKFGKGFEAESDTITCNVELISESGERIAQITGFTMKKVEEKTVAGAKSDSLRPARQNYDFLNEIANQNGFLNEGLTADEGIKALEKVLEGCFRPQVIVSTKELSVAFSQANYIDQNVPTGKTENEETAEKHPRPDLETEYVPPRNDLEKRLTALWEDIFRLEKVGIYDDFFALGGDSLLLIQLHTGLKENFKADIAVVDLYKYTTIAQLAKHLSNSAEEDEKPDFEKVNQRVNKQLEILRQKRKLMQRRKRNDLDE